MFNQLIFDPLYKKHIFAKRGLFGVNSPARDEIELMEDNIKNMLSDEDDVLKIAIRPAGWVTGFINPSSFFSRLEHAFGIWLLVKNMLRRIRVVNSDKQNVILYRFLNGGKENSYVDEFVLALFLSGLFFTSLDEISGYCSEELKKNLINQIIGDLSKRLEKSIKKNPFKLNYEYVTYLLGKESSTTKIPSEVRLLRKVFFDGGILDLKFLDKVLRTSFYIGIPLAKSLVADPSSYETYSLLENINKLFNHLTIQISEVDKKDDYSLTIVDKDVMPIAKGVIGTCRELAARIGDFGMGYMNRIIFELESQKTDFSDKSGMILLGPIEYYLQDKEKRKTLLNPGIVFLQGKLKKDIDINELQQKCIDGANLTAKDINILQGTFIPKGFFSLKENSDQDSNEYESYRSLCIQSLSDNIYIVLMSDEYSRNFRSLSNFVADHGTDWFESYFIIKH